MCLCVSVFAVTQQGNVRTIARKGKPGKPIDGAVIRIRGSHNAVQSRDNGDFSVLLYDMNNGDPYAIASIVKAGYEPAEQELIGRRIPCSDKVPLEILLVSRTQLQQEKDEIAAKARANVEVYYEKRLAELNRLLAAKRLTEQEYSKRLEELEGKYERFEPLLQAMSDKLARTDYERLDSLTTLIQNAIESGDPDEAERLVREKGDLDAREAAIREQEERIARAQQTIDEAQAQLDQQRAITARSKKELADDYFRLYSAFLSRFQNDSANFYIQKRAALDTLNVDYQLQAGQFVKDIMADLDLARMYFERAYRICETQYGEISGQMATTCHEIGYIYKGTGQLDTALEWYNRSLAIREQERGEDSPAVAETLNNLGELYTAKKDWKQAMEYHDRALKIREKHFDANSLLVAESKNNIAGVYFRQEQYKKAEALWLEVHDIYAENPKVPQRRIADNNINLGGIAYKQGRYAEALSMFEQAAAIYTKVLGAAHPQTRNANAMLQVTKKKIDSLNK